MKTKHLFRYAGWTIKLVDTERDEDFRYEWKISKPRQKTVRSRTSCCSVEGARQEAKDNVDYLNHPPIFQRFHDTTNYHARAVKMAQAAALLHEDPHVSNWLQYSPAALLEQVFDMASRVSRN